MANRTAYPIEIGRNNLAIMPAGASSASTAGGLATDADSAIFAKAMSKGCGNPDRSGCGCGCSGGNPDRSGPAGVISGVIDSAVSTVKQNPILFLVGAVVAGYLLGESSGR